MAFNINPGKQQFTATAAQTLFTFNFAIFVDTDIKVYKTLAGAVANDVTDLLTLTTNYTVSINGTLGGTITLLVGAGINDTITIARSLPISRTTDYVTNGDLFADTLDLDQDYQTYLVLDQNVQLQRAIIVPESLGNVDLNIPAPVANSYLRWNATANALENDTTIPDAVITTTNNVALTNADVVLTHADVVLTHADVVLAQKWASELEDVVVSGGLYSAFHWAQKAAASALSLIVDLIPTNGSTNAVSSDGVFDALALKADLSSPALTGTPTAPTATVGTNTTQIATTAFVLANGSGKQIQPITASVAANALTVSLSPTTLDFRSTPLTSGTVNTRTVTIPISVIVPSTATLGTVNAIQARLVLIAIDNVGTVELAIVNLAGGNNLDETTLINTIAIDATADLANVIYSTTARTGVPFRVVGFIDITEATAGTWATAPSTIQGYGGQALAAMSSIGYGQTWQDVTGSRVAGTTYTNTTGKPISVCVTVTVTTTLINLTVNGVIIGGGSTTSGTDRVPIYAIVPNGGTYIITTGATVQNWAELR